ncbi:MAG: glycosyltransferase family 4 protein [Ruminococcaceae bacterium]|nr:glycosyltransferase family 4 protein [Oscillospiraceae bacterium]
MKILLATDVHVNMCNGRYYFVSQVFSIVQRYYEHFGKLNVCARISHIQELSPSFIDVTDMIDEIVAIPSLAKAMVGVYNKKIKKAVAESDFVICRCGGIISYCAAAAAKKLQKPYLAEVISCAWDAFWNHGLVGKIVAPHIFFRTKSAIYHADYAVYVTNSFLQKRYPCKNESVGVSDVLIRPADEAVLQKRLKKIENADYRNITLMTTAAVDVRYKGQQFVIKSIPKLNKAGIRVKYLLIGGGDNSYLRSVAKKYRVEDQVEFAGRRTLPEVFELLDQADFYVQPSLQEGLPRSVVEAMSRACPVIGARTAGIPELIDEKCVVKRKSVQEIVNAIKKFANIDKMSELAKQNFKKSEEYEDDILTQKRNAYYEKILGEIDGDKNQ